MPESELEALIDAIVTAYRLRCYWMDKRQRMDNQLRDFLRRLMGWRKGLPRAESERIKAQAKKVVTLGERYRRDVAKAVAKAAKQSVGKEDQIYHGSDAQQDLVPLPADLAPYAGIVLRTLECREIPAREEQEPTERLRELARQLPVWPLVSQWQGFAEIGLATIVAECARDLRCFPTRGKLLKFLSLGVVDGIRQGNLPKTAAKTEWIKHGYNRRCRARIKSICDALMRCGNTRYRTLYDKQKIYEMAKAEAAGLKVVPADKIPKRNVQQYRSLKQVDMRARRYAEQHIVCDVWRAWHRVHGPLGKAAE